MTHSPEQFQTDAEYQEAAEKRRLGEKPGTLEWFEGRLRPVVDASRTGWWRFHAHYDRDGYCDNPGRGY